jgi:hypothetical protein
MGNVVENVAGVDYSVEWSFLEILSNCSEIPPVVKLIMCLLGKGRRQNNREAFIGDIPTEFLV